VIKGRQMVNGKPWIVLGLSRLNCERLLDNKPIMVDGRLVGLPTGVRVVLLGGETEDEIVEDLRSMGVRLLSNCLPDDAS
jgi:hypothetical protein